LKNGGLSLHRKKYRENIKNSDNLNGVHNCRTASLKYINHNQRLLNL